MTPKKILIVEDQWESSDLICDVLKLTFKEWDIEQVESSREAIDRGTNETFDLMIIDIALADGLTGLDIIRKLYEAKAEKTPRMILVTGLGDKAIQGQDAGRKWMEQLSDVEKKLVAGFFQKPYPWREFLTTIAHSMGTTLPEKVKFFEEKAA